MGTTTNGFPYPESTDFVTDGAQAIEDLATSVDSKMGLYHITTQSIGSSGLDVNGCFTSAFYSYRIIINISSASNVTSFYMRLRNAGTNNTTSNYYWSYAQSIIGATNNVSTGPDSGWRIVSLRTSSFPSHVSMDIYGPQLSQKTMYTSFATADNNGGGSWAAWAGGGIFDLTNQFDSFTIFPSAGTITTGRVSVYGYND